MRFPALLASLLVIPACAVEGDDEDLPEGEDGVGDYDETTTDDKADATAELRARIDGLTVWMDPVARKTAAGYVMDGRASRNLDDISSWVPDDAFAHATITGKRTFTVTFELGHELNTMMSGMPIFLDLDPSTGEDASAAVWLKPRLTGFAGSSRIYLDTTIDPVRVEGAIMYRGAATAAAGYVDLRAWTDGGEAEVTTLPARKFQIDWSYAALTGGAIHATATKGATTVEKTATMQIAVSRLGVTRLDPREVWDGSPEPAKLASDLRAHLVAWYADHGADVTAAGGNTLAAAQAAVDGASFTEVTDPEEDPHGRDLELFRVYRHADVAFPGSDNAWFVAYTRTGVFVEAYDFN